MRTGCVLGFCVAYVVASLFLDVCVNAEDCSGTGSVQCYKCTGDNCRSGCAKGESCLTSVSNFRDAIAATYTAWPTKQPDGCQEMGPLTSKAKLCFCNSDQCNAAPINKRAMAAASVLAGILAIFVKNYLM